MENVAGGFTDNSINILVSSGPRYPPIALSVNEFHPAKNEFLVIPVVNLYDDSHVSLEYAPPYGLTEEATSGLEEKWLEHIEAIIHGGRYEGEWEYGDTSKMSWKIYTAIYEYWKSTKVSFSIYAEDPTYNKTVESIGVERSHGVYHALRYVCDAPLNRRVS